MVATDSHPASSEVLAWRQPGTGQKTRGCLPPGGALLCLGGLLCVWGAGGGGVAPELAEAAVAEAATPPFRVNPSPVLRTPAWRKVPFELGCWLLA